MQGLCGREDCRRQVLPQLAQPKALLRLIGEARVEQKSRQEPLPAERRAIEKVKRARARKIARSQRRGMYGLLRAIASALMPVKSQAQRRLLYAAAEGKVPGIKPSVGREFVQASRGETGLPNRVRPTKRRAVLKRKGA